MSPDTEELIDRIWPERVSRLGRQRVTLDMPFQGQGHFCAEPLPPGTAYHLTSGIVNRSAVFTWGSELGYEWRIVGSSDFNVRLAMFSVFILF